MSNRPVMNKANRDRYLSKLNKTCRLFKDDLRFELDESGKIVWSDIEALCLSHTIPFTRSVSVVPEMVYNDYINICRVAEANFRMIAMYEEFQEQMVRSRKWMKTKDDNRICVMKIKQYKLEAGFIDLGDDVMLVILAGCLDKDRPKDLIYVGFGIPRQPTNEDVITATGFLKEICDKAATFYQKRFSAFVSKYVNYFSDHPVGVYESAESVETVSDDKTERQEPAGEFVPDSSHTYYIKKKDGSEEILAGGNLNYDLGDIVVDLTRLCGEGNQPSTPEEFHKLFPDSSAYQSYASGQPEPKVIVTTEGTGPVPEQDGDKPVG